MQTNESAPGDAARAPARHHQKHQYRNGCPDRPKLENLTRFDLCVESQLALEAHQTTTLSALAEPNPTRAPHPRWPPPGTRPAPPLGVAVAGPPNLARRIRNAPSHQPR